jgi:serine/threonine protein kinase
MGEVWQAFDTQLERDVAIKLMRKDMVSNEDAVRRFTREARAVARLNHPNIVQVYAFGNEKGISYMVMELVEGETVAQCIKRHCKLTVEDTLHIVLQAIEGLSYANARGIIHRDIKPSNLMLTDDNRVKIADFGLAKMVEHDTQMTAAGTAMGSPNYMSPEQARGEEADHRSDIYALGISLYQIVLGELPFTAQSPVSVLLKQIQEPLPEPEELRNLGNGEVMAVLKKMTEKTPEQRYQTYGELAAALAALQPNIKFKGAHIATASMPVANPNTPTHVPSISPAPPAIASAAGSVSTATPSSAPYMPTPSDQKTAVVSSRTPVETATDEPGGRRKFFLPVLAGAAVLLISIPILLFLLSNSEKEELVGPADPSEHVQMETPATITAESPTPATATQVVPPAAAQQSPDRGTMEPINITALVTPRPTPLPGVVTTVTPLPNLATLIPSASEVVLGTGDDGSAANVPLYDADGQAIGSAPAGTAVAVVRPAILNGQEWYVVRYNGGEAFIPRSEAVATTPTPGAVPANAIGAAQQTDIVYVLGTAGAGANEQVSTYLDRNGRTPYKSFPAGAEVRLIDSSVNMLRVKAPDDKIVYVYKRMASLKR